MKKSFFKISIILIACVVMLTSCSTLASLVGLEGLAGFDSQSKKNLEQGFLEIDWLNNEETKEAITMLCESGDFTVSYSDRYRMLEFVAFNSEIRIRAYNDRIDFVFQYEFSYSDQYGWVDPRTITLECYGKKTSANFAYDDVERVNTSSYNTYSQKYVYTRYETVSYVLSNSLANFLNENWGNNDLFVVISGNRDVTFKISNNDLVNLYRTLYEELFPYSYLKDAAESAIVEEINGLTTISAYEASAISYYLSLNTALTGNQLEAINKLVKSKIR